MIFRVFYSQTSQVKDMGVYMRAINTFLDKVSAAEPHAMHQVISYDYCDHKSDGKIYANADFSNENPFKCKKCGQVYK